MKRDTTGFIKALALLMILTLLTGCHYVSPDAGEEAVLTQKPWFATHGGVVDPPVTTGSSLVALSTDATIVKMTPVSYEVAFDDYSSQDNIILDLNTTLVLQVTDSVKLIKNFGPDWFKNNIPAPYSLMVRDIVKTQSMKAMMSDPTVSSTMDQEVSKELSDYLAKRGIPVRVVQMTLGRAKPNAKVLEQMNATAAQQQRQLTEQAQATAETARKEAETKRAEADNAYRSSLGYTTEQYANMQIAQIQADACKAAQQCIIAPPGSTVLVHK